VPAETVSAGVAGREKPRQKSRAVTQKPEGNLSRSLRSRNAAAGRKGSRVLARARRS